MVDSIKKPQKMGQGMIHSVSTQKICRLDGSVLWIYLLMQIRTCTQVQYLDGECTYVRESGRNWL